MVQTARPYIFAVPNKRINTQVINRKLPLIPRDTLPHSSFGPPYVSTPAQQSLFNTAWLNKNPSRHSELASSVISGGDCDASAFELGGVLTSGRSASPSTGRRKTKTSGRVSLENVGGLPDTHASWSSHASSFTSSALSSGSQLQRLQVAVPINPK